MRLKGIDLLRGIAVIGVVVYHFFVLLHIEDHPLFGYVRFLGQFGVALFFVISGYLIYHSVQRYFSQNDIKHAILHYALHRLFRILPAYYVNLLFVIFIYITLSHSIQFGFFLKYLLSHLTFTTFFIYKDAGYGINGAYWTLNIEMVWYIIAPILFLYFQKAQQLIILFLLSLSYLFYLDTFTHYDTLYTYYLSFQLPGQLIYFISGILIYKYSSQLPSFKYSLRIVLAAFFIAFFIYLSRYPFMTESFLLRNLSMLFVASVLFMLLFDTTPKGVDFIEWIGKISYSIYLWHMPILFLIGKYLSTLHLPIFAVVILFFIALLGVSSLSYYFIEERGFQWRKKVERLLQ